MHVTTSLSPMFGVVGILPRKREVRPGPPGGALLFQVWRVWNIRLSWGTQRSLFANILSCLSPPLDVHPLKLDQNFPLVLAEEDDGVQGMISPGPNGG